MKTILLVEDSKAMREHLVQLLQKEFPDFQILQADQVALGLKHVMDQVQTLDLVLVDYYLGTDNGLNLLENVRFLEESGTRNPDKTPILKILITEGSHLQNPEIQEVQNRGFKVLGKPTATTQNDFIEMIRQDLKNLSIIR